MAAIRIVNGILREVWREAVPLNGGTDETITTGISATSGDLSKIFGFLIIEGVVGNPNLSSVATVVGGFVTITVSNSAGAGNTAIFSLDIMLNHSVQQASDSAPAQIHTVSCAGAIGIIPADTVSGSLAFGIASNAGVSPSVSRSDHNHGTPIDPIPLHNGTAVVHASATNLEHIKGNVVSVALSGATYVSVKSACDAIALLGPSAVNPYHIKVSPGVFNEVPFTVPPYTILEGAGEENTVIFKNSNTVHLCTLEPGSEIRKLAIDGPSALGQAAIRRVTAGTEASFVTSVLIRGGYYGILCDSPAVFSLIVVDLVAYRQSGNTITQFVRSTGFGNIVCRLTAITGTAGTVVQGFVCDGANAQLKLYSCSYDVVGGTDAVYATSSGTIIGTGNLFSNGTNCIHVGNLGASFIAIHGSVIRGILAGFTHDILIDTIAATVHYSGSLSRSRVDNAVGAQLVINATDIEPGVDEGAMILGELSLGPTVGGMTPMLAYGQATWLTGLVSGGAVTRHGGGSRELHVAAGTGYINDGAHAHQTIWGAGAVTIAANAEEYVYVDATNTIQHSAIQPAYASNIILAQAKTNATDVLILTRDEISIGHQSSRLQEYLEDVIGPISVSGGQTTANAHPLSLDVDSGEFAVGLSERTITVGTAVTWVYWYRLGAGLVWTPIVGQDHIDTNQWNNAGALVPLAGGSWKKDLLYIVVNSGGTEYHVVYGQTTFANQPAAEAGAYPIPPDILGHYGMRSGGVVVEGADIAIDSIMDARPLIGQAISVTGGVFVHAALAGLAADDHAAVYLNAARALIWHNGLPGAHVTNGNTHDHTAGAGNQIDHTTLNNIGANTHAVIDAHLINVANPHVVTAVQVGAAPLARVITAGTGLTGGGDLTANMTFNVGANADGSIVVNADDVQVGILATDAQHGVRGGGTQHAVVGAANGFMSSADKTKLDSLDSHYGKSYQQVNADARSTLTGAGSDVYPGSTKLTLVTPALAAGTYKLSWSAIIDYSTASRNMYLRIQNTTDVATLWETQYRPSNSTERHSVSGYTHIIFAGVAKTFTMEFHNTNVGDTSGVSYARMDILRVS
jgi:hypothetical protein